MDDVQLEYHKQGQDKQFKLLLAEIVNALEDEGAIVHIIPSSAKLSYKLRDDKSLLTFFPLHIIAAIDELYHEQDKDEYASGLADIHLALAAKALSDLSRARHAPHSVPEGSRDEFAQQFVAHLKRADEKQRINEYTWLVKGYYEIVQGEGGVKSSRVK